MKYFTNRRLYHNAPVKNKIVLLPILFEESEIKETFILLLMLFPLTFFYDRKKAI